MTVAVAKIAGAATPPLARKSNALATAAYSAERTNVTHSADSVMAKKGGVVAAAEGLRGGLREGWF